MVKAEAADDATLVVTFAEKRARDVPLYVAGLPIFSQDLLRDAAVRRIDARHSAWDAGRTKSGNSRSIATSNSSGSRIGGAPIFRSPAAAIISTSCATNSIAIATSRSRDSPRRATCIARNSPRGYGRRAMIFPAVKDGRVKRETLPDETPSGAQGWFINTRRDKFKDPRVREALIQAFDFEWTNKTIMYGAYARTHSPFQNSDMMASGPPSPEELKLLEPFRGKVPDEVFGMPFVPPVSDGSGQDRTLLRKASQLLQDAGLRHQGRQAAVAERRSLQDRISGRRAGVSAASRALYQESRHTRDRGELAAGRSRAVPGAAWRISTST